jgi:putative transposase
MLFQNTIHVFEDLDKEDLVSRKRAKNMRKRNYRTPWKRIHKKISEVALTAHVDSSNAYKECPRCGYVVETQEGQIFECPRCGLKMSRHRVASVNIRRRYLEGKRRGKRKTSMRGFPHSNEPEETMKVEPWVGASPSG